MIATRDFLFVHLHKTAGQFVSNVIFHFYPDAVTVGYHYPRCKTPTQYQNLPVFAIVRNPWDWYVSWYAFNMVVPKRNPIFRSISDDGVHIQFDYIISSLLSLGGDTEQASNLRKKIEAYLPDSLDRNRGIGITKQCIRYCDGPLYSWQVCRMLNDIGGNDGIILGRFENLRNDLIEILSKYSEIDRHTLEEYVMQADPVNQTGHKHYREYYDDHLFNLVAEKEQQFIKTYGYL